MLIVAIIAAATANAVEPDSNNPIAAKLYANDKVSIGYVSKGMLKKNPGVISRQFNGGFGRIDIPSMLEKIDFMQIYTCDDKESAALADEYIENFMKIYPDAEILSKVRQPVKDDQIWSQISMFGVPMKNDLGKYFLILICMKNDHSAKLVLTGGSGIIPPSVSE